jgi:hypothetical protein
MSGRCHLDLLVGGERADGKAASVTAAESAPECISYNKYLEAQRSLGQWMRQERARFFNDQSWQHLLGWQSKGKRVSS